MDKEVLLEIVVSVIVAAGATGVLVLNSQGDIPDIQAVGMVGLLIALVMAMSLRSMGDGVTLQ